MSEKIILKLIKKYLNKKIKFVLLLAPFFLFTQNYLFTVYAEDNYLLNDLEINSSTKSDNENNIDFSNPFEIVEMIRRANSMNDATKPSDAIDDALKSYHIIKNNEDI